MKQHTALLAALAAAAALTACGRQQDDELATAPRKDNSAVADAEMSASHAADRTAQLTGDMAITAKVNAALVADDQLKATMINVDTRAGQVTLTGEAPDAKARERATTLASAVDGVKQVSNQLAISPKNG
ncbi:MAG TPA: BON domain-containing protein [Roseateles sp.]